jgi:hypothetical protein
MKTECREFESLKIIHLSQYENTWYASLSNVLFNIYSTAWQNLIFFLLDDKFDMGFGRALVTLHYTIVFVVKGFSQHLRIVRSNILLN